MPNLAVKILAADDDAEDLQLIEEMLTELAPNAKFMKFSHGEQILSYLNILPDYELPCLIILDYNMPEMTGAQVISQLCKTPRYKVIPKIILSTSNSPSHVQDCLTNGATRYFVKPNNMKELNRLAIEMISYCK